MPYLFFFDLDSTITKSEILPEISKSAGLFKEMQFLTEQSLCGKNNYFDCLAERIKLLSLLPVSEVCSIVSQTKISAEIYSFLQEHRQKCYIVTSNIDVWISGLIRSLGMEGRCFCSSCRIKNNFLDCSTLSLIRKDDVVKKFPSPIVAIGDGENDIPMLRAASIGIAYGGVRKISQKVISSSDKAFYDDNHLCAYLETLAGI